MPSLSSSQRCHPLIRKIFKVALLNLQKALWLAGNSFLIDHWKTSFEPDRNKTKLVKTFFVSLSTFPAITSSGLWLGENKWETKKRRNQSGLFLTDFPMLKKTLHAIWWGKWYYSVLLQPFFHAVSVRTVIKKLPASSSCCLYEFWKAMSENEM